MKALVIKSRDSRFELVEFNNFNHLRYIHGDVYLENSYTIHSNPDYSLEVLLDEDGEMKRLQANIAATNFVSLSLDRPIKPILGDCIITKLNREGDFVDVECSMLTKKLVDYTSYSQKITENLCRKIAHGCIDMTCEQCDGGEA